MTANERGGDYGQRLTRLENTLYVGNGKDAVTTRLDRLEVHMRNLEKQRLATREQVTLYSALCFGIISAIPVLLNVWNWMRT